MSGEIVVAAVFPPFFNKPVLCVTGRYEYMEEVSELRARGRS